MVVQQDSQDNATQVLATEDDTIETSQNCKDGALECSDDQATKITHPISVSNTEAISVKDRESSTLEANETEAASQATPAGNEANETSASSICQDDPATKTSSDDCECKATDQPAKVNMREEESQTEKTPPRSEATRSSKRPSPDAGSEGNMKLQKKELSQGEIP